MIFRYFRSLARKRVPITDPLFDPQWYLERNPEAAAAQVDPYTHYSEQGWKDGHSPHPLFDVKWYFAKNTDIASAGIEPLRHYKAHGWKEGRSPHPLFDPNWYLGQNPDVASVGLEPLTHYLQNGWREGRFPHPLFDPKWYLEENPDVRASGREPFSHYLHSGWREGRDPTSQFSPARYMVDNPHLTTSDIEPFTHYVLNIFNAIDAPTLIRDKFGEKFYPLPVYALPQNALRINMITDSIDRNSLFGGVATAMIVCALLAEKWNCPLRILTRTAKADPGNFGEVLRANGIEYAGNVEFLFADVSDPTARVSVSEGDVFVTTSHWTTSSVMSSVAKRNIIYLLQEDERIFFADGDERLKCANVMTDNDIHYLVNTEMLYRHLVHSGCANIAANGAWFEPSFPGPNDRNVANDVRPGGKKTFLFYARPHNQRNLFYFGVEIIQSAILKGILDTNQWNIVFVGKDISPIKLAGDLIPTMMPLLSWSEYRKYISSIDLGLCLMASPHPSYPPLDVASLGGVAVSNTYGPKRSLESYSKNIVCGAPTLPAMLDALRKGVQLAASNELRRKHLSEDHILRDWRQSFGEALAFLTNRFGISVINRLPESDPVIPIGKDGKSDV
jgi:hypothetical protein